VIDNEVGYVGSQNLARPEFVAGHPNRELVARVRGPAVAHLEAVFASDWYIETGQRLEVIADVPVCSEDIATQLLPSGPAYPYSNARDAVAALIHLARRRLVMVTPYFVPDDGLRNALRLAARRGVQVTIAIPSRSNHRLTDFVRARAMRDLAGAGVTFRMLPFMAHAKAVVVDEELAMCGSINLDLRSLLLNHEANVVFYGTHEIEWLAEWIETTASAGEAYRARRPGLLRDVAEGLLLTVAFQL